MAAKEHLLPVHDVVAVVCPLALWCQLTTATAHPPLVSVATDLCRVPGLRAAAAPVPLGTHRHLQLCVYGLGSWNVPHLKKYKGFCLFFKLATER